MAKLDALRPHAGGAQREAAERLGRQQTTPLVWAGMGVLYIIWGSTYLAIRVAIETVPPFLMGSVRFLIAGGLLYLWSLRGSGPGDRPGRTQWGAAAIVGGALLLGGNGGVVWAEQHVASGIVALLVATVPLWIAVIDKLVFGQRLSWPVLVGLALGLLGLVLLVGVPRSVPIHLVGAVVVVVAALSWAAGSLYSRGAPLPKRPVMATGMEMLAGGALLGVVALATGEVTEFRFEDLSLASALATAYLIVFGSMVAFTTYIWLLGATRTSVVSTYAYVNPVVAVFLGAVILDERITAVTVVAGGIIVLAVALIVTARGTGRAEDPSQLTEPPPPTPPSDAPPPTGDRQSDPPARSALPGRGAGE